MYSKHFLGECITFQLLGLKTKHTPLLQYLLPVGFGPSSKTCPWCPPHFLQWYSVLGYPTAISVFSTKTPGKDSKKDGQPEPLSYLALEVKSFVSQPTQW